MYYTQYLMDTHCIMQQTERLFYVLILNYSEDVSSPCNLVVAEFCNVFRCILIPDAS